VQGRCGFSTRNVFKEFVDVSRFESLYALLANERYNMSVDAPAIDIQRTRLLWPISFPKNEPFVGCSEIAVAKLLHRKRLPALDALLSWIFTFHRLSQGSDRQLTRLLCRDRSMPTDGHPFADTVTIAVIDEVRATSARLYENAETLQFIAPDRELLLAGRRCVDERKEAYRGER
jgi:hypothetical protein